MAIYNLKRTKCQVYLAHEKVIKNKVLVYVILKIKMLKKMVYISILKPSFYTNFSKLYLVFFRKNKNVSA